MPTRPEHRYEARDTVVIGQVPGAIRAAAVSAGRVALGRTGAFQRPSMPVMVGGVLTVVASITYTGQNAVTLTRMFDLADPRCHIGQALHTRSDAPAARQGARSSNHHGQYIKPMNAIRHGP